MSFLDLARFWYLLNHCSDTVPCQLSPIFELSMCSFVFQIFLNPVTFASTSTIISVDTGRYILDIYTPYYCTGTKAYLRPLVFLSLDRLRLTCATAVGAGRLDAYPCSASEKYKKGVASDDDAF